MEDGGLIKLIVVGVVLLLSWIGKGLEKRAQSQAGRGGTPPRRGGLDVLAELERKLREAQQSLENAPPPGTKPTATPRTPAAPTTRDPRNPRDPRDARDPAARAKQPAARKAAAAPEPEAAVAATRAPGARSDVASRHLETRVSGITGRHLQESVEGRRLDLDLTHAREGHASILDTRPETDDADAPRAPAERIGVAAPVTERLPARLTELQRAFVWSEVLAKPVALR